MMMTDGCHPNEFVSCLNSLDFTALESDDILQTLGISLIEIQATIRQKRRIRFLGLVILIWALGVSIVFYNIGGERFTLVPEGAILYSLFMIGTGRFLPAKRVRSGRNRH
jgi:hypothetical protein